MDIGRLPKLAVDVRARRGDAVDVSVKWKLVNCPLSERARAHQQEHRNRPTPHEHVSSARTLFHRNPRQELDPRDKSGLHDPLQDVSISNG
jgi:hypothetical protein